MVDRPAAKEGDQVFAIDTHYVAVPSPGGPVPTPTPMPFQGMLDGTLSKDVRIQDRFAAIEGTTVENKQVHMPSAGPLMTPPSNRGEVIDGSSTVFINDRPATWVGARVKTCNDCGNPAQGTVMGESTVRVGS